MPDSNHGYVYRFSDNTARPAVTYYYWLENVDAFGRTIEYGPVVVEIGRVLRVPRHMPGMPEPAPRPSAAP
jgi:hypothetical protein